MSLKTIVKSQVYAACAVINLNGMHLENVLTYIISDKYE